MGTVRMTGLSLLSLARLRGSRRGVVLVTAALSLVAMIGVAALTIDLGRLAVATQRAQDVADAAAMGAVYQLPDQTVARARLDDVVWANNAASSWPEVTVTPGVDVAFYGPGSVVPHIGALDTNQHAVRVTAHVNDEYTFGRIAGLTEMHTQRSATAVRTAGGGQWPAIFAMQEAEDMTGVVSHGGAYIDGDVHSNGNVKLSGNGFTINGQLRYKWVLDINQSVVPTGGILRMNSHNWPTWPEPYPVGLPWWSSSRVWGFAEVRQHFVGADGLNVFVYNRSQSWDGKTLAPGIHIVNGNVTIKGGVVMENVTLVTSGTITTNGNGAIKKITPYVDSMGIVSYHASTKPNKPSIEFNGASMASSGTIFAPNGPITYNGGSGYLGSLIGYQVTFNGNGHRIGPTLNAQTNSEVRVRLVY